MTGSVRRLLGGIGAGLIVGLLVAACGTTAGSASPTGLPAVTSAPSATVLDDLSDTAWHLVDLGGTPPLAATNVTLAFDRSDTVSGNSGCNTYGGQATIDGTSITFGPLISTKMACIEPEATAQEAAYLAALESATSWRIVDGQLELSGTTILLFEPA